MSLPGELSAVLHRLAEMMATADPLGDPPWCLVGDLAVALRADPQTLRGMSLEIAIGRTRTGGPPEDAVRALGGEPFTCPGRRLRYRVDVVTSRLAAAAAREAEWLCPGRHPWVSVARTPYLLALLAADVGCPDPARRYVLGARPETARANLGRLLGVCTAEDLRQARQAVEIAGPAAVRALEVAVETHKT